MRNNFVINRAVRETQEQSVSPSAFVGGNACTESSLDGAISRFNFSSMDGWS